MKKHIRPCLGSFKDESGVALVLTLVISMLLLGIGMSLSTNSMFEVEIASNHEREAMAFYAAQTGMELAIDGFRTNYTVDTLPADGQQIFYHAPITYPGSTVPADYTVTVERRDSVGGSIIYPFPIFYTITSTGRFVPTNSRARQSVATLSMLVSVSPRSLANYALFYDEFAYTLSFSNFFRLAGRLAVNELGGVNTSVNTRVNGDFYCAGSINGGPPIVSGNITENGGKIGFPSTIDPFAAGASADFTFEDTTRLIFFPDGTVTIYNALIDGGTKHVPIPMNGVIAVDGDVIVEGTVNGRVTVTSSDDILINGHIRYADQTAGSWDVLGLVAQETILIPETKYTGTFTLEGFEPNWSSGIRVDSISGGVFGGDAIPEGGPDLYVDATLVSLTSNSNAIVNPNYRPPGYFYIYGNTIGKKAAQTIRVSGESLAGGLSLQITENKKLDLLPPPGFPMDTRVLPTFFAFREIRTPLKDEYTGLP